MYASEVIITEFRSHLYQNLGYYFLVHTQMRNYESSKMVSEQKPPFWPIHLQSVWVANRIPYLSTSIVLVVWNVFKSTSVDTGSISQNGVCVYANANLFGDIISSLLK